MRDTFVREMELIDQDVVRMGALVEAAISEANLALAENDCARAEQVMAGDDAIDQVFVSIEKQALVILAQQAPVARDLRLVITILRAVNELERAGDLAYNIAKTVCKRPTAGRPKAIGTLIYQLGEGSMELLKKSIDAWAHKDVSLAAEIVDLDDDIDDLYGQLFHELYADPGDVDFETALNLVLIARWFERIADHGVNIAEGIRYYVTGDTDLLR